jgi:O-acetyl-ADP-ribose deacetylase (regulator of RNase III)
MDKQKSRQANLARRGFLRAAGGAGALASLAAVAGAAPAQALPVQEAAPAPAKSVGYHETEHIRQYYRTARYW